MCNDECQELSQISTIRVLNIGRITPHAVCVTKIVIRYVPTMPQYCALTVHPALCAGRTSLLFIAEFIAHKARKIAIAIFKRFICLGYAKLHIDNLRISRIILMKQANISVGDHSYFYSIVRCTDVAGKFVAKNLFFDESRDLRKLLLEQII